MITNLRELRQDGQYLEEGMTTDDIWDKLGGVSRTVGAQWQSKGQEFKLHNSNGLWAHVLPERDAIAINEADDSSGQYTNLRVLNEDGSLRFEVPTAQSIQGGIRLGTFAWFETPRTGLQNCFAVMFVSLNDKTMYQLDIDGATGQVVGVYPGQ
jgi:hypothetical protein